MADRPAAPSGVWLTQQLRRAEAHAHRIAALLEKSMEEVLTEAGATASAGFTARATALAAPRSLTAAAPDPQATMVCLKPTPEQASRLALSGGEPAEILHVTLCYLGKTVGPLSAVVDALRPVSLLHASLSGVVGGVGVFAEGDSGVPQIALPSVPGLVELRVAVAAALAAADIEYDRDYGYVPHMTLAYTQEPGGVSSRAPAVGQPLTFADLLIVRGDTEIIPLPLSGQPPLTAASWIETTDPDPADRRRVPVRWQEEADGLEHRTIRDSASLDHGCLPWAETARWGLASTPSLFDRIRTVAEAHRPEGGYGETWYRDGVPDGSGGTTYSKGSTVFWTCADWTTNEEIEAAEAAFLAIDGVGHFEYDAEGYPTAWQLVYGGVGMTAAGGWFAGGGSASWPRPLSFGFTDLPPAVSAPLYQWFAPGDPPPFLAPAPNEILDVEALIARITERLKPVRDAAVRAAYTGTTGVPLPLEEALAYYHSPKAFELNGALRSGKALTAEQRSVVETLDAAFAPSRADMVLWRGVPHYPDVLGDSAKGFRFDWSTPGYLSTSADRAAADIFATGIAGPRDKPLLIRVDVPKGTPMLRIPAGDYGDQDEWLLPRDINVKASGRILPPGGPDEAAFLNVQATSQGTLGLPGGSGGPKGFGIAYDVTNPLVAQVLAQSGSQIVDIAETTQLNVMRIVAASYREGLSIPNTAKAIRAGMAEAAPARARLIARTEMVGAVNGGSLAAVQTVSNATGVAYRKVWMTAPGSKHPRHYLYDGLNGQQRALTGKFDVAGYPLDHPGDPQGPAHEICNCFPAGTLVAGHDDARAGYRRRYAGRLVTVETAVGHRLSGTPNHPVLTDAGWKPLGELREGDHLISASLRQVVAVAAPDVDHAPTRIEQVVSALARQGVTRRVAGRAVQFHGDLSADGEVEVVTPDCQLRNRHKSALPQHRREHVLVGAGLGESHLPGAGSRFGLTVADTLRSPTDVRGGGQPLALLGGRLGHADAQRGTSPSWLDSGREQVPADDPTADPVQLGERLFGDTFEVARAEIIAVKIYAFHGEVFNLQTDSGAYIAGGIIAHNCRCAMRYDEGAPSNDVLL